MNWLRKFWVIFDARNKEFYRDPGAVTWNLAFPFLVIFGFGFMFSGNSKDIFKVATYNPNHIQPFGSIMEIPYIQFVEVSGLDDSLAKLKRHSFDFVISFEKTPPTYWLNSTSPKGQILQKIAPADWSHGTVEGKEIRYVDWLISGLLGMNMMFSALFGVGYVIVRYRKTGVLKRLKASPIKPWEFILAQVLSRLVLIMAMSTVVFVGCHFLVHFQMLGSYLDLAIEMAAGAMCLISLGLLFAARVKSEELAGGVLNLISWPMMFLSGVWFSLEGTPHWVQKLANIFPLTPIIAAARAIMTEGASLQQVAPQVISILAMTLVFFALGSVFFRWD